MRGFAREATFEKRGDKSGASDVGALADVTTVLALGRVGLGIESHSTRRVAGTTLVRLGMRRWGRSTTGGFFSVFLGLFARRRSSGVDSGKRGGHGVYFAIKTPLKEKTNEMKFGKPTMRKV